ncbi:hypothetical protein M427DRAFT_268233 [Gonapodya prolifera JEL478]|uniref:Uncharacterized protein n=1 Tax=Gonapodya prolifera (strain JEL478) TaxID=1344416 RepID=A0A139AJJ7_GONPJ|nr:hypothetical protein M427DRAFT_268233 [Gonapodya prolifera JEL478]|eukprot:KXS16957.1 hypothetical protein M427DRAFT_268233 [Gonapodya prolifera JEL478]
MDPPEPGSSAAFLDQLLGLAPPLVIYVSCGPKTQIKDIALLRSKANFMRTSTRESADQSPGEVRHNKAAEPYVNSTLFSGESALSLDLTGVRQMSLHKRLCRCATPATE